MFGILTCGEIERERCYERLSNDSLPKPETSQKLGSHYVMQLEWGLLPQTDEIYHNRGDIGWLVVNSQQGSKIE